MAGEKFYLDFISDGWGKVEINEPIGYSGTSFELKQKNKGYGRDIYFSGGETQYEFSYYRDHYLDKLLYYNHRFGFESKVNLIIQVSGIDNIVGELDFATATTDDLEYFKCKVIQNGDLQILKRRRETKVDIMSNTNVDGVTVDGFGLFPQNMLLKNKPTYQVSKWEELAGYNHRMVTKDSRRYTVNTSQNLIKSEINDSYTFFAVESNNFNDFELIKAKNNLKDIKINIKGCSGLLNTGESNSGNGYVNFELVLRYGNYIKGSPAVIGFSSHNPSLLEVISPAVPDIISHKKVLLTKSLDEGQTYSFSNLDFNYTIDSLNRDESIWLCYEFYLRQSSSNIGAKFFCDTSLNLKNIDITTISYAYNSITPTFRLIDVMRQVVKSTSGLDIIAPRFDIGGEFYDNRLFNGNFLRQITKNGFKISLEDIEKSLPELNCDYEIAHDGRIFFGTEKDFYTNIECGFFDNTQFSSMNKMANPRFTVNEFWFMYKKFQSLKENEEVNSADVIHGESKLTFFNKRVENKKEVSVEWCRDAFLIEENRRKSLEITTSTSSQNDDDIFAIDTIDTLADVPFTEVTELQHSFISNTQLSLKTNGDVNFISMGITVGSLFSINAPDQNAREYTVYEVSESELKITKNSGANLGNNNDGIRSTSYSYTLDKDYIPFTNYTNQKITAFNLQAPKDYSNLRYSIGQNTWNYWKEYIATCNFYWSDKKLQNSWYKNNPECTTVYQGKTIKEGDPFDTNGITPILTPFLFNDIIFCNVEFEDFIELQKRIRTDRGFIRCIDKNNRVIKVHPIDMKWEVSSKQLTIKGEERYEASDMTIETSNLFTLINNETRVKNLLWKIQNDKLSVYDMNRQRLYNERYWDVISVNNALPTSLSQLKEWMGLIGTEIE